MLEYPHLARINRIDQPRIVLPGGCRSLDGPRAGRTGSDHTHRIKTYFQGGLPLLETGVTLTKRNKLTLVSKFRVSSLLKNVFEAASARQKQVKKRSLHGVNEHFEPVFNAAVATQIVFQQAARVMAGRELAWTYS